MITLKTLLVAIYIKITSIFTAIYYAKSALAISKKLNSMIAFAIDLVRSGNMSLNPMHSGLFAGLIFMTPIVEGLRIIHFCKACTFLLYFKCLF